MKLNTINNEYQLRSQDIQKCQVNEKNNSYFSKYKSIYPQDKVDIFSSIKHVIQSVNSKQVELTYSIPLKKVSATIIDKGRIEVKNENLPKELQEINSPKVFSEFVKNTYAKVTDLNDGQYKLEINHRLLGGMFQEHSGSITPKTVGKKDVIKFDSLRNSCLESIEKLTKIIDDATIYCKKLKEDYENIEKQYQESITMLKSTLPKIDGLLPELQKIIDLSNNTMLAEVEKSFKQAMEKYNNLITKEESTTKLLINTLNDLNDTVEEFIEADCTFRNMYQENIEGSDILVQEKPAILRLSIIPEKLIKLAGKSLYEKVLHPIEQEIFNKAIQELSKYDIENYKLSNKELYPNSVILVDIFGRENNSIKIDKDNGYPETHTIALWKVTNDKYIIIDPNRVKFSEHIINNLKDIGYKIEGYIADLYNLEDGNKAKRDCIDIAIKIAFEIQEQEKIGVDLKNIEIRISEMFCNDTKSNPILKNLYNISNVPKLASKIAYSSSSSTRNEILSEYKNMADIKKKK